MDRLIIDGNTIYEIDEECEKIKKQSFESGREERENMNHDETRQIGNRNCLES